MKIKKIKQRNKNKTNFLKSIFGCGITDKWYNVCFKVK